MAAELSQLTVRVLFRIIEQIEEQIEKKQGRQVFILHGRAFTDALNEILSTLSKDRVSSYRLITNIPTNPQQKSVQELAFHHSVSNAELILAIGGGSVIDTAKLLVAVAGGNSFDDIRSNRLVFNHKPAFWAVPTTAGSGSEATHFAVFYDRGDKYSAASIDLVPDALFLEPALTLSCPMPVTLSSSADALCQSVESFWAPTATANSRAFAQKALQRILPGIPRVIQFPDDMSARDAMLTAANFAGRAINITKTTAGHALSYGITTTLGIPHGIAVLLVMGPLVQLMNDKFDFFKSTGEMRELGRMFRGDNFVTEFMALREYLLHHFTFMPEIIVKLQKDVLPELKSSVNEERLVNHPVPLTLADQGSVLESVVTELTKLAN